MILKFSASCKSHEGKETEAESSTQIRKFLTDSCIEAIRSLLKNRQCLSAKPVGDPDEARGAERVPLDDQRDRRGRVALHAPRHRLPQSEHARAARGGAGIKT